MRRPISPVDRESRRGQSGIGMGGPDERRIDDRETHARAHTPMKPTFPGLKELLLLRRPNRGSADIAAIGARALFQAPEAP